MSVKRITIDVLLVLMGVFLHDLVMRLPNIRDNAQLQIGINLLVLLIVVGLIISLYLVKKNK